MPELDREPGLTWRVISTFFLLGLVYLVVISLLLSSGVGILPVMVVSGGLVLCQYYFSDRLVLRVSGARLVSPEAAPELHAAVERLCALAGLPKPRVAIVPSTVPNAFATGRNPRHAVVAVTTALTKLLPPEEMEAVLAHEITHVRNRDMAVITFASFFATVISLAARMLLWVNSQRDGLSSLLVSAMLWVLSFILLNTLSRYREYAADRGAALLTGKPAALASALTRLHSGTGQMTRRDLRQASRLSSAFYITPPGRRKWTELFSTHPTLEHRLEALRRLEARMVVPTA